MSYDPRPLLYAVKVVAAEPCQACDGTGTRVYGMRGEMAQCDGVVCRMLQELEALCRA